MDSSIVATADILDSNNRVTAYGWKALAGLVIGIATVFFIPELKGKELQ